MKSVVRNLLSGTVLYCITVTPAYNTHITDLLVNRQRTVTQFALVLSSTEVTCIPRTCLISNFRSARRCRPKYHISTDAVMDSLPLFSSSCIPYHRVQVHIALVYPLGQVLGLAFRLFFAGSQTHPIILVALFR